jgi:hypothetical protein
LLGPARAAAAPPFKSPCTDVPPPSTAAHGKGTGSTAFALAVCWPVRFIVRVLKQLPQSVSGAAFVLSCPLPVLLVKQEILKTTLIFFLTALEETKS